jgi:hypothetical protein
MNIEKKGMEAFEADQTRLELFCQAHGIKVVDDIRRINQITDRIFFNRKMLEVLDRQSEEIKTKFAMPVSVEFDNSVAESSVESRVSAYEAQAN